MKILRFEELILSSFLEFINKMEHSTMNDIRFTNRVQLQCFAECNKGYKDVAASHG